MDETTEYMIRKSASEKLGLCLSSDPARKKFVRQVVNSYLTQQNAQAADEDDEDSNEKKKKTRKSDDEYKKYDDEGDLIICRLSKSRRVTITEFRGRTLVSMREYYRKDGKDLPTSKA